MVRDASPRKRTAQFSFSDLVLNVAAGGGLLCIVLVILAITMNITLIMFKTGSMAPTIPAGSVALVQEIPASSIEVGDVLTVDRARKLPVTHRVTSINPPGPVDSRTFTMRGDANTLEDAEPYTAKNVRIMRGHIPGLAAIIVWFSHPAVLGAITLAASALVTWAFWPRDPAQPKNTESDDAESHEPGGTSEGKTARRVTAGARTLILMAAVSIVMVVPTDQAHAADTETHINGTVLRLTSIGDTELMTNLQPGIPVEWQVGVSADAPDPGKVDISLSAYGHAANAQKLIVAVDSCTTRWNAKTCSTGRQTLIHPQVLPEIMSPDASAGTRLLTTMTSDEQRWLKISVTLADVADPGFSQILHVHANGLGDDLSTEEKPQTLPETGVNLGVPLLLALGALLTGIALAKNTTFQKKRRS